MVHQWRKRDFRLPVIRSGGNLANNYGGGEGHYRVGAGAGRGPPIFYITVLTPVFQFAIQNIKIKIYRSTILPVVLYESETWSLTLREERRLRVFENRVLRRIFGPKRHELTGEWRKLHTVELNDLTAHPVFFG